MSKIESDLYKAVAALIVENIDLKQSVRDRHDYYESFLKEQAENKENKRLLAAKQEHVRLLEERVAMLEDRLVKLNYDFGEINGHDN